jgi:hypothetical protein
MEWVKSGATVVLLLVVFGGIGTVSPQSAGAALPISLGFDPAVGIGQATPADPSDRQQKGITIGFLDANNPDYPDGCGCWFRAVDEPKRMILIGSVDGQAWMSIDGEMVVLRRVRDTTRYRGKKGDRYAQKYRSDQITVEVRCMATGFGDTHAVYCDTTITLVKNGRRQSVKADGSCGC